MLHQIRIIKASILFCLLCSMTAMAQEMVYVGPDKNNQKVIDRYNRCHYRVPLGQNLLSYSRKAKDFTAIFGVKNNSLMSNDDVEINFLKKWVDNPIYNDKEDRVYFVQIRNKTSDTIYIDRSRCYRTDSDGSKYCYYDSTKCQDSLSTQRMLAIPPHSKRNLTDYRWVKRPGNNFVEIVEYPEEFLWNLKAAGMYEGYVYYDEVKSFTEETSPYHRTFLIAYSRQPDFATYSLATIHFYIREIIGWRYSETIKDNVMTVTKSRLTGDYKYSITSWMYLY
ncbi:MAG: hypothetical protein J6T05_03230 [Prevotella sp.]|nr:hypothetical protein [Prevotella sp.]